jgi:type III pantothenate kinase
MPTKTYLCADFDKKRMNLIVDIGNTRTKLAFFEKNMLVEKAIVQTSALSWLNDCLQDGRIVEATILSATGQDTEGVEFFLKQNLPYLKFGHDTPLPIKNKYTTPETLGKDRLAAVVAANFLFAKKNCLVIDSGTCITYNFLEKTETFLGGNIAPGLTMRLRAMNHFTAKLPLVERHTEGVGALIGDTTETAMRAGAQIGLLSEVEGYVNRLEKKMGKVKVILTGGDGLYLFENLDIKEKYFEPNLVLQGLNQILNYHFTLK